MRLTEKYRPKFKHDFVGNKDIIVDAEKYLFGIGLTRDEEKKYRKRIPIPILLTGRQGIGKTSLAHVMANEYDCVLDDTNSSMERRDVELKHLQSKLESKGLVKKLFLIDEVDGMTNQDALATIIKKSKHPIIMTANEKRKISYTLKKSCMVLEMYPPKLYDVVKRIEDIALKEGVNITFEKVSSDIRSSINAVFHGGNRFKRNISDFQKVEQILKMNDPHDIDVIWLIDNLDGFYFGLDIKKALDVIKIYYATKRKSVLKCMPLASKGRPEVPYYFKRMRKNERPNK